MNRMNQIQTKTSSTFEIAAAICTRSSGASMTTHVCHCIFVDCASESGVWLG
jgi:hypothetical protein